MKKDQYILAITGLLDQESAGVLLREVGVLFRTGYHRIALDARDLGPVLPEGVLELRRGIEKLAEETIADHAPDSRSPEGIRVECVELSDHASAQFLLNGVPVEERRAIFSIRSEPPETGAAVQPGVSDHQTAVALPGAEGWLVDCPHCRHASRVRAAGDYACPVCGVAFRMDPSGEVVTV